MSGPNSTIGNEGEASALSRGRGEGLALAALALSAVSFLNLLGAEKALLAIVLAILGLSSVRSNSSRRQCWIAIALASTYVATIIMVLVLFHDKLGQLVHLLQTLG